MVRTKNSAIIWLSICFTVFWWSPGSLATSTDPALSRDLVELLASRPAIRGRGVAEADLKGRAVVVSFFASWCPPCHTEFRHLAELRHAFAEKDLTIVAINQFESFAGFDDGGARLQGFLDRHEPKHFVITGNDEIAARFGGVTRIPTMLVFDGKGRPVYRFIHRKNSAKTNPRYDELHKAVTAALPAQTE